MVPTGAWDSKFVGSLTPLGYPLALDVASANAYLDGLAAVVQGSAPIKFVSRAVTCSPVYRPRRRTPLGRLP